MRKSTEEFVNESRDGDSGAFTELVRLYERAAWIVAWRVLRDHHLSSDAIQNAFIEAYTHLPQLKTSSHFGPWLMRIAHREALRISRRVDKSVPLDPVLEIAENQTNDSDSNSLILAIGELPEHERMVVALKYFSGYSVAEIARDNGRPIGTVSKQLSRAVNRLRKIIQENYDDKE